MTTKLNFKDEASLGELNPKRLNIMRNFKKNAFTLIELLIVVSIVGLVTAVAVPALQNAKLTAQAVKKQTAERLVQDAKSRRMLDTSVTLGSSCDIAEIAQYLQNKGADSTVEALEENTGLYILNLGTYPNAQGRTMSILWTTMDVSNAESIDSFLDAFAFGANLDDSKNLNAIMDSADSTPAQKTRAKELLLSKFTDITTNGGSFIDFDSTKLTDDIITAFKNDPDLFNDTALWGGGSVKSNPFELSQPTIDAIIEYMNSAEGKADGYFTYPLAGVVVPEGIDLSGWHPENYQAVGIDLRGAKGVSIDTLNGCTNMGQTILPKMDLSTWEPTEVQLWALDFSETTGLKATSIAAVGWGMLMDPFTTSSLKAIDFTGSDLTAADMLAVGFTQEQVDTMNFQ